MLVQAGLYRSCSETTLLVFPRGGSYRFRWITKGYQEAYNRYIQNLHEAITPDNDVARIARLMKMYDDAVKCTNVDELCSMITEYKLTWEHLPTTMLNELKVWQTLLRYMPIEALIRNLGRMTKWGVFPENSEEEEIAVGKIRYDVSLFYSIIWYLFSLSSKTCYFKSNNKNSISTCIESRSILISRKLSRTISFFFKVLKQFTI